MWSAQRRNEMTSNDQNTRRDKTRKQPRMKVMGVHDVRVSPRGKELGVDEPTNAGGI